jgi:hypothetical protein
MSTISKDNKNGKVRKFLRSFSGVVWGSSLILTAIPGGIASYYFIVVHPCKEDIVPQYQMQKDAFIETEKTFKQVLIEDGSPIDSVVMMERLKSVRKKNSKQSPEEHLEKVNSLQEQLRKEFYQISKLKKEAAIQMLKSDEGQKRLREALKIYYLKLTAEERQELKPLVTATLNWSKELTQTGN